MPGGILNSPSVLRRSKVPRLAAYGRVPGPRRVLPTILSRSADTGFSQVSC